MDGVGAGLLEQLRGQDRLVQLKPALLAVLLAGHAHQHGEGVPHALLDGRDDLARQPRPVDQRPAVGIGALVVAAVEEHAEDVAVRDVDLDRVGAGFGDPLGGVGPGADEPGDVVGVHLLVDGLLAAGGGAHLAELLGGAVGQRGHVVAVVRLVGRDHRAVVGHVHARDLAVMGGLHAQLGAGRVHGVGECLEAGDVLVVGQARLLERGGADGERDRARTGDDEPGAALGAGDVVVDLRLLDLTVLGDVHVHGRQDDAVGGLHGADPARRGETGERGAGSHGSENTPVLTRVRTLWGIQVGGVPSPRGGRATGDDDEGRARTGGQWLRGRALPLRRSRSGHRSSRGDEDGEGCLGTRGAGPLG